MVPSLNSSDHGPAESVLESILRDSTVVSMFQVLLVRDLP